MSTTRLRPTLVSSVAFVALVIVCNGSKAAPPPLAEDAKFFEREVQPILAQHCVKCHGGEAKIRGGLRLSSRAAILEGGDSGPAVSLDALDESLLLEAINYESYEMPPSGKLPQPQIDILTRWVKLGLPGIAAEQSAEPAAAEHGGSPEVNDQTRRFWSFQPISKRELPRVSDDTWGRAPIDAFVLSKLEAAGLDPAPRADKIALLRRAYYDLTGLPPQPEAVDEFLADGSPDAFERVIDRLLDSPHYGEHWARHWLDLVRYAESNSYERDGTKPFVWRYRDYVIRSLNGDKPYDQFVIEQLAGDELDKVTPDSITATGYYRLGIWQDEPVDPLQELFEDLDDITKTTGEVFLGMTIGCARCHDHKLDPVPQRDYYRFVAFFRNIRRYGVRGHNTVLDASVRTIASDAERRRHDDLVQAHEEQVRENARQLERIEDKLKADLVGVENDEWKTEAARIEMAQKRVGGLLTRQEFDNYVQSTKRRDELRRRKPPGLAQALCVTEHGRNTPPTHVLVRGNAHVQGEEVQPGFLTVLGQPDPEIVPPPPQVESTGRRLALARWIASSDNPLAARVIVNRVWQYHFGRGIVRSSSDFGFQGTPPTHPRLLDWLASDFMAGGWRLKRLHKLIMLSSTYQMSSRGDAAALAKDPTNDLFWRFDMRRLSAEEVRDSILAVNGSLNRDAMYGPSIYPVIPPEVLAGQSRPGDGWGNSSPAERARRSIYVHVKRSLAVPMLASFDAADTDASCPVRFSTTQPTQALGMLNSQFINDQARVFASFLRDQAGEDPAAEVELALRRAVQRPPGKAEVQRGVDLLNRLTDRYQLSSHESLKQFCVAMLNLNEFLYLD